MRNFAPVLAAVALSACSPERAPADQLEEHPPSLPGEYFQLTRTISLEESDDVINVWPTVTVDGNDGYFVVDRREARARLYSPDGSLINQFGRRGGGPGEFGRPQAGYRHVDGTLVVVDSHNGLVRFDPAGDSARSVRLPLHSVYGIVPHSAHTALLVGRLPTAEPSAPAGLLHLWDLEADSLRQSFFPTPGDTIMQMTGRHFGWAHAAVYQDTIVAVYALSDTLYFFDAEGSLADRVPLRIRGFRFMNELPGESGADQIGIERWLTRYLLIARVFPLPDGTFLVQYERPAGRQSRWNLLRVDRAGRTLLDLQDTPRLLAVNDGELIFHAPDSPAPDRWQLARLR